MNSIRTSTATITLIEDQIIHFMVDDGVTFDLNEMLEIRKANHELSKGSPYCVVMEAGSFTNFTKEAREASASEEHTINRIGLALIQNNLASKLLTDIYLRINKPVGKTKVFKSKEEGVAWLREMRDEYNQSQNKG